MRAKTSVCLNVYCRAMTPAMAVDCAAIHASAFAAPWTAHDFTQMIADPAITADGLWLENSTLGGFILSRRTVDEAEVLTLAVVKAARKRGGATKLLAFHFSRLMRAGTARLFLEVAEDNQAARALYQRFGFIEVGRRAGYYAKAQTIPVNALVLRCDL